MKKLANKTQAGAATPLQISGEVAAKAAAPGTVHLMIRGYADGEIVFEDPITLVDAGQVDQTIKDAADRHIAALRESSLHMVEIEFLDELDPRRRFFRFGPDPRLTCGRMLIRLNADPS